MISQGQSIPNPGSPLGSVLQVELPGFCPRTALSSNPGSVPPGYLRDIFPAELSCCANAVSFLQSDFWGDFKTRFGWTARGFLVDWAGTGTLSLLVLWRPLVSALSFAYVPWGPELPRAFPSDDRARSGALGELARALRPLLPGNTAFIRFDPPWYTEGAETPPPRIEPPFTRAGMDVQPPDTVVIGLAPSGEEILQGMKPKWRYNIGLAAKKGVVVDRRDEQGLDVFYALYRETAKRDGIAIHGQEYYKALFACSREKSGQEFRLYLASHEGIPLAGSIVLFRGSAAVYLYGASSSQKRNLMAPYALQWRAIQDARAAGCTEYDLYGIPPREDPGHPMAGLYRFKTGFGGRIIHRSGSWDYTYRPVGKNLFTTAESLRKLVRSIKKR